MKLNLLYFVRLLLRHIGLLLLVPVVLAVCVFFLTQNQPDVYSSKARVYTGIASGSTIELDNNKIDYKGTGIAYGNLLNLIRSRATVEMVGLKLFSQHMALDSVDIRVLSVSKQEELQEMVPDDVKALVVKGDIEKTYDNLLALKESNHTNFIYELINLDHPDYSYEKILEKIGVKHIMSSDFVDVTFESEDPAICQNALLMLCDVFVKLNAEIKVNQSDAVVKYFERQLELSTEELKQAEDKLLLFNKSNNIINYYEQTRHLASEKEDFEIKSLEVSREYFGAKSVLEALEARMATHERKRLSSKKLMELREELSQLNFEISTMEIGFLDPTQDSTQTTISLVEKRKRLVDLKSELASNIDVLYSVDHNTNGAAASNILNDWLENLVIYESAKAEMEVMGLKRKEFKAMYQEFSPLGATMKKLERKIDIAEREYLSLLYSLGLAKLRQQNVELQSNIKLAEAPYFPISPEPSKRILLVIVAGVVGFVLVAFTILILEFLDGNINTAARAEDKIGLKVSSIFPVINTKKDKVDYKYLLNKAVNAISRNIILNQFQKSDVSGPVVNMFISTQENEGKTFINEHLIAKLCELGYNILYITYDETELSISNDKYQKITYDISDQLYKISKVEEFGEEGLNERFNTFDFVILELPGIIKIPFPVKLASTIDYTFLVTRANRAWGDADANALSLFTQATTGPEPMVILNGVKVFEMETVLGELPKKRSLIRRWIKNLVQLHFFTKKTVA
ncbi:MAG: GumC family protein [Croceivirga sp.]